MIAAAFDNLNCNGGAAMGMGGVDRISSDLLIRLLLVSDPLFVFWVYVFGERALC